MATSLTKIIEDMVDEYSNHDPLWVQFVMDHRKAIISRAGEQNIDLITANQYDRRLYEYLKKFNIPYGVLWIVLEINQMDNEMDFTNMSSILLPSMDHLQKLRALFKNLYDFDSALL